MRALLKVEQSNKICFYLLFHRLFLLSRRYISIHEDSCHGQAAWAFWGLHCLAQGLHVGLEPKTFQLSAQEYWGGGCKQLRRPEAADSVFPQKLKITGSQGWVQVQP